MPNGRQAGSKGALKRIFGAVAGAVIALSPMAAADAQSQYYGPGGQGMNWGAVKTAPTDPLAYRHPTLASDSDEDVGVLLVLSMDASGSMSDEEWNIQLRATASALMSTKVRNTIRCKSGDRSVAIAVVGFGDNAELLIPWVDLRPKSCSEPDPEFDYKIQQLATMIARVQRPESGSTAIGTMLEYVESVFKNAPWKPTERRVLDVSGDGANNSGIGVEEPRQQLMNMGVTINGLAIVNDDPDLASYYRRELISNEFRIAADGLTASSPGEVWTVARAMQSSNNGAMVLYGFGKEVEDALKRKISTEVAGLYPNDVPVRGVVPAAQVRHASAEVPVNDNKAPAPERRQQNVVLASFTLPRSYGLK
jgi:hypothetical protein